MADHQIDWAALLNQSLTNQSGYAGLGSATSDSLETAKGVVGVGGTMDKIIDAMVADVRHGAPGSNVAREVAGLAVSAKREQHKAVGKLETAQADLRAANIIVMTMAAKVKEAHNRVMGI